MKYNITLDGYLTDNKPPDNWLDIINNVDSMALPPDLVIQVESDLPVSGMVQPKYIPGKDFIDEYEELKDNKINTIKSEASNIILSKYPDWKQRNMIARSLELKTKDPLSEEEQAELNTYQSIWNWIEDIRAQSNTFEDLLDNENTVEGVNNYTWSYNV